MIKITKKLLLLLCIISCYGSCTESSDEETLVVTEEIVYVSSEVVRLTGRVLSIGGTGITDHGFMIADNESFNDAVVVSLGDKPNPGRFYGEYEALNLETGYFCRSFATSDDATVFGNIKSFETLVPSLKSYAPATALPGAQMILTGRNLASDTKVFFGDTEAQILELNFESEVIVRIPPIKDGAVVPISIQSQGQTLQFIESFEYIFGTWDLESSFINPNHLLETMSFKVGDEFFFGLGKGPSADFNSRIWKWDLNSKIWSEIFFFGNGVAHPFYDNGVFGTGQFDNCLCPDYIVTNDWYEYNVSGGFFGEGTFDFKGTLPFALYKSKAITIEDQLYVIGGFNSDKTESFNIHAYDETANTWTVSGQIPFHIDNEFPDFIYNNEAYFMTLEGVIWAFSPGTNAWREVGAAPFEVNFSGQKRKGISEVIDGKAYIGVFERDAEIWEYDIENNSWKEKVAFSGNILEFNSATFVHDEKVFVIRATNRGTSKNMEIWSFDPKGLNL